MSLRSTQSSRAVASAVMVNLKVRKSCRTLSVKTSATGCKPQVLKVCSRLDLGVGISDLWGELVEEDGKAPGLEACNEK